VTVGTTHMHPLGRGIGRRPQLPFHLGAGLDLVLGLDLALFGDRVADLLLPGRAEIFGITAGTFMQALGIVLLLFAAETIVLARAKGGLRRFLPAIPILNGSWVAISLVVVTLWHDALSGAGIGIVLLVALLVGALAAAQGHSLRADPIAAR